MSNNTTEDYPDDSNYTPEGYQLFTEIFTIAATFCVALNVLLIFVTLYYKRLRRDKTNIIIANGLIINSFYTLVSPLLMRLYLYTNFYHKFSVVSCLVDDINYTSIFCSVLLIMLLSLYWYIGLYFPNTSVKFSRHLNFFIGFVYVICLFCMGIHVEACFNERFHFTSAAILGISVLILFLLMLIINIANLIQKCKLLDYNQKNHKALYISNVVTLSLLLIIIVEISTLGQIVAFIVLLLILLNPLYVFIILSCYDKDYYVFLKHVLSFRHLRYDSDELLSEQPIVYSDVENGEEIHK